MARSKAPQTISSRLCYRERGLTLFILVDQQTAAYSAMWQPPPNAPPIYCPLHFFCFSCVFMNLYRNHFVSRVLLRLPLSFRWSFGCRDGGRRVAPEKRMLP